MNTMRPILLLFALLLSCLGTVFAAPAGEITHLSGILSVKRADGTTKILAVKSPVDEGDTLTTEKDTYARLKFIDGAEVVLRPGTQLKVESYRYEEAKPAGDNVFVSLLKGGLRAVTGLVGKRNKEKIAYQTPTATIGIRGTHFGALFCKGDCADVRTPSGRPPRDGLHLDVASGIISVTNKAGSSDFNAGKFGYVQDENTLPLEVPQEEGFRVTMPSSIAVNRGFGDGIGETSCAECIVE
jgi:hypothetical protein